MITSIQTLQQFISTHQFKRIDGNILFNAEVKFYTGTKLNTIISPVQIILLPNEIAIYILEFLKEEYNITEMYSTGQYYFSSRDSIILQIRENKEDSILLISILPVH
jgi:hypothetical protein